MHSINIDNHVIPQNRPASWVPASNGQVPVGSVEGGRDGM